MKALQAAGLLFIKLLLTLPLSWWGVMSIYGAWICIEDSESAGKCLGTIVLAPIFTAFPAISDGEDRLLVRVAFASVLAVAAVWACIWQFGARSSRRASIS